jgi:hypothetical protein
MSDLALDRGDATELAELLTFLADWISGVENQTLSGSLNRFIAVPGYDLTTLHADLHRFVFLLGASDGESLFRQPPQ